MVIIEWIPYGKDIKGIANGGFGAEWIDGPIIRWGVEKKNSGKVGQCDVAFK